MTEQKKRGGASRPSSDYAVGYRRPPVEHQFRKGEPSRNPDGRRGRRRPATPPGEPPDFLDAQVTLAVAGKPTVMTRDEALDHALFQEAIKGNVQASRRLDERRAERERRQQAARSSLANPTATVSAEDEALIAEALHRRSHAATGAVSEAAGDEERGLHRQDGQDLSGSVEAVQADEGAKPARGADDV